MKINQKYAELSMELREIYSLPFKLTLETRIRELEENKRARDKNHGALSKTEGQFWPS